MKPILISALVAASAALLPASLVAADASENWTGHCAKCHGPDGAGKTKMGAKLKIRDLTSAEVQKAFTDEQAINSIKVGTKDEKSGKLAMPAFAEKLSDEEITAMVSLVRSMGPQ
ncbi:MAG TPA: cytochrome c [Opitutaceae bacterium]